MIFTPDHAALFVDYENIFYFIKNRSPENRDPSETAVSTIRRLRSKLLDDWNKQCIVQHAYADFERIEGSPQGAFYLMGIEPHNVLGTDHKNAADMRLCIDAMETLYTRKEIDTFILVAGDRDYIPLVQHLRKHAKSVFVVSFKGNVSGDLLQVAEERNFIDAASVLPEGTVLEEEVVSQQPRRPPALIPQRPMPGVVPPTRPLVRGFSPSTRLETEDERNALRIMLDHFGDKSEIWMTPYLHRQRAEMPHLAEYERRGLINGLQDKGVITVEKRQGAEVEYSVMIVNWNHPDVQDLNPGGR